MRIARRMAAYFFIASLLPITPTLAENSYLTNPLALQYSTSNFTNLTEYYYHPTALIVTSGCNAGNPAFQDARAQGAEVLEYIDPVELPNWDCTQANTFYSNASNELWTPYHTNYGTEPMLDISFGSTWSSQVVNYVKGLMTSGKVDGVFIDVLGAKVPSSTWTQMSADEQNKWTRGAINLVRQLDALRRQLNPKFIIVNNNYWYRGDAVAVGYVGEWYVDGICLEHAPPSDSGYQAYAGRDYSNLGHRRVVAIASTTADAISWAQVQGITHVTDQPSYQTPDAPALTTFHPLSDLAYTAKFFGTTDPGGTTYSAGLGANFKRGSKFALSEAATVLELSAYMDGGGGTSGTQHVRMEIYADSSGVPGALVASSDERLIPSGMDVGWVHFTLPPTSLSAGSYWIVIHSGDTGGVARDYGGSTAGNWYGDADTYADGGSNPFGTGTVGTGPLAVNATYVPTGQFGRTTIAATPSSGLGANFKRGSKFTLGQNGTLLGLNAYLDGNGGATGSQQLRMALYQDSGGTPAAKIAESNIVTVASGQSPGWVSFATSAVSLSAGSYWIVIQSGDTGGVARDYGDGAADWFGGADTFSDGASDPFGTGSTGTVTMSVFASYY